MNARSLALLLLGALASGGAHAVERNSLPYPGTPDWTEVIFSGTSMTLSPTGDATVLTTAQARGVWFGNAAVNSVNWSIGTNTAGNYLGLSARFSAGAADWSAYLHDGSYSASFHFAPTDCLDNCYAIPAKAGYAISHAANAQGKTSTFFTLDLTQTHTFEWLLKGGQVYYRVDGVVVHAGAAHASTSRILVIGDGSGTTRTGVGSMTVTAVAIDTAPAMNALVTTAVPEPGSYALLLAGLGIVGTVARRRRSRTA